MAWLRIDDAFDTHPKIVALGTDQKRWTWTRILVYTTRHRTPRIPAGIADVVPRATRSFLAECIELGLVDVNEYGEMEVHDWARYQPGVDRTNAERQARYRERHRNGSNGVTRVT